VDFWQEVGVQTSAWAEIWFEIVALSESPSELSNDEYTDRSLSVGGLDREEEDWPPALVCRG